MILTNIEIMLMILAVAAGTMLTRFLPFLLFPQGKRVPKVVAYLGRVLPASMMGLLVVYCLRNVSFTSTQHGIPETIAILSIIILHKWKQNVLLSIGGGTMIYMVLIRLI